MTLIRAIWAETFGLFVDDGALALQSVVLIALVAAAVKLAGLAPLAGGALLILGCVAILAASLWRKTKA